MNTARQSNLNTDEIASFVQHQDCGSTTVREILAKKPPGVWVIGADASVFEALRVMAERNVGALVVVEDGRVLGVISERDYARKVILSGKSSRETLVREIMGSPAVAVGLETTVSHCMDLMTGKYIRHLPVIASEILVGCISIGDVVKTIIQEQGRRIGQYEDYISGNYPG